MECVNGLAGDRPRRIEPPGLLEGDRLERFYGSPTMAAQLGADPYRYAASLLPVELADQPQAFHRTVATRICAQRTRAASRFGERQQRGAQRDVPVGTSWAFTPYRTMAGLMRGEPSEERIEAGINAFYTSDVDQRSPFSVRDTVIAVWRAMRTARAAA